MDSFIQEVAAALSASAPPSRCSLAPPDAREAIPSAISPTAAHRAASEARAAESSPRSATAAQATPALSRSHRRRRQRKALVAALRDDLDSCFRGDTLERGLRPCLTASDRARAAPAFRHDNCTQRSSTPSRLTTDEYPRLPPASDQHSLAAAPSAAIQRPSTPIF